MENQSAGIPGNVIWRYAAIAAAISFVLNLVIYIVGNSADYIPDEIPDETQGFSLITVVLFSVIPVFLAAGLKNFINKTAPGSTQLFIMVVLVVSIISVVVPFFISDIDTSYRMVLVAMHLVTAGTILALTLIGNQRAS